MKVPPATVDQSSEARVRPTYGGVLVAGVGNVLRGDDGVGVQALQVLQSRIGARTNLRFTRAGSPEWAWSNSSWMATTR